MNKLSIFFFACSVFLSSSLKADVYDRLDERVRVNVMTETRDDGEVWLKFEYCPGVDQDCEILGSRDFYSLQELEGIRDAEIAMAILGIPLVVIASGMAGFFRIRPLLIFLFGATGGYAAWKMIVEDRFLNALVLRDSMLEDRDIALEENEGQLSYFVERLSFILSTIDASDEIILY